MPNEALNVIGSISTSLDANQATNVKAMALSFAGLDTIGDIARESVIDNTYNGIATGFLLYYQNGEGEAMYNRNLKNLSNSLIFNGYDGRDGLVNSKLSYVTALGGDGNPNYESLKCCLNALFCSCSLNRLSISQVRTLLSRSFSFYSQTYPAAAYQLSDSGFMDSDIGLILSQDYSSILRNISEESPKDFETDVYSYSYFDTSNLFSQQIDYQRMGDSETQYYYVSGKIIFDEETELKFPCEKTGIINSDGQSVYLYKNLPCRDEENSVYPVNNLSFSRIFPDAPNVTGSESLQEVYKEFNRFSEPKLHNYHTGLFSDPELLNSYGAIESDLKVFEVIDEVETGQAPQPPNSTGYSNSHIGGTNKRWKITGYDYIDPYHPIPKYGYVDMTGFKVVPLSLDRDIWGSSYDSIRTNPDVPIESKLIRALNIEDHLGEGNVGGPIVSSNVFEIPCLYINEELYNKSIGTNQSGNIYIGTLSSLDNKDAALRPIIKGQLITGIGVDGASYDIGDTGNYPKINFSLTIYNSGLTGQNSYYAKRGLGMGDGGGVFRLSGERSGNNAGYIYKDSYVLSGNTIVPTELFFQSMSDGIIGKNKSRTIDYIDGFETKLPESTEKLYAYDETGGLIIYNYFYPGIYEGITVPLKNWEKPFPILDSSLTPVIKTQTREHYHPRFSTGPYSAQRTSFLYPTASGVNKINPTGFPTQVEINVTISEEVAREYFQKRTLKYKNGAVEDIKDLPANNNIFNTVGDFKTPFAFSATSLYTDPEPTVIAKTSDYNLVPDYWVDSDFLNVVNGNSAIHDLFTGACLNSTGILKNIELDPKTGILYTGSFASGYYVFEYVTGYYQGQETSYGAQDRNGIQEAGEFGFYVTSSNGSGFKKLDFSEERFVDIPTFSTNPHHAFYHSGGLISISGAFGFGYSNGSTKLKINLEKDCDLCAPVYMKYIAGAEIDKGGCKYVPGNYCLYFAVYPTGTISINALHRSSSPENNFKQGVRMYHTPYLLCEGGAVKLNELIVDGTGINTKYSEMSGYDNSSEFYISNSKNRTLTLKYTLPSYSMLDRFGHPEYSYDSLQVSALPNCNNDPLVGSPINLIAASKQSYLKNRQNKLIPSGADPIWFEIVGGNSGVSGGYHSKNIIGDSWIGMSADSYGISIDSNECPENIYYRSPENDDFVLELNYKPNQEITLHTRALKYTPGYFEFDKEDGFQKYDLTGIERMHKIKHSSYNLYTAEGLPSTGFEEYSSAPDDYLFPEPTSLGWGQSFSTICKYTGVGGNIKSSGVINYWKKFLADPENSGNGIIITGYRYRDKSRTNFKINSVKITKYGSQPVDLDQDITLTGKCIISGEFGYHSQAESAVFTEGIFLKDYSENYQLSDFYSPNFVSDALLRLPLVDSGSPISPLESAPSRCLTRKNISRVKQSGNEYIPHLTEEPYNYNKFIVPALSDVSYLNDNTQYAGFEKAMTDDGFIFPGTALLLNASVAQHKGTAYESFLDIPNSPKIYYVQDIKQFYDSSVTDAALNTGYFVTTGRGLKVTLDQNNDLTGFLGPENAKYSLFKLGLYDSSGYSEYPE